MNREDAASRDDQFTRWVNDYRGIFVRVSRAYASEPEDQADLHQEMMLQVWSSLSAFRRQAQPSTWIYRVCLNTALSWRRGESNRQARIQQKERLPDVASSDPRPGTSHEQEELLAQLYLAIRQLAPADRSLVLLSLDGLSYAEISEVTGLTENHVGVALTRARGKLAEKLKGISHELE